VYSLRTTPPLRSTGKKIRQECAIYRTYSTTIKFSHSFWCKICVAKNHKFHYVGLINFFCTWATLRHYLRHCTTYHVKISEKIILNIRRRRINDKFGHSIPGSPLLGNVPLNCQRSALHVYVSKQTFSIQELSTFTL